MSTPTYTCPHCKKEQHTILEWFSASICSEYDAKTEDSTEIDRVGGDFENYACPNCEQDLPFEIGDKMVNPPEI